MKPVEMPKYIDAPFQVLFWEIDEVAIFFSCMALGIIFEMLFPLMLCGLVVLYIFSRYKHNQMDGILLHLFYWHGLMKLNNTHDVGVIREYNT
ncbi:conjugal transfer pilus assembly protein TraL [Desulfacinum hydrothermale DSM 13146]|uniref:Conjugal transfer pilus assembly protein TraL n=1 Tax=Desulfacinum hydrothermale DSM 13146 TaxID=1121390 RepID=A0A1W1XW38_9BACT|nr:type IV conjugative transfer system protein TraL [Desulfacinum hydrothermale]SMC28097.1 conjugal transfer pilus assembly protein TraL [Desulfacinum hydrothermale DSM 13146]